MARKKLSNGTKSGEGCPEMTIKIAGFRLGGVPSVSETRKLVGEEAFPGKTRLPRKKTFHGKWIGDKSMGDMRNLLCCGKGRCRLS